MTALVAALAALGLLIAFDGATGVSTRRSTGIAAALERLAAESGIRSLTGPRLIALSASLALVALVVVAGITSSSVVGATFGALAAYLPFSVARSRRQRRRRRFRDAWPDAIDTLIAGVRSGVSLSEACVALTERGPDDLAPGFRAFASTYRASGSFDAALQRLARELSDPVADRVAAALSVAHSVGGTDLVLVLRTLGDFVREDTRVRKEIEARWSWTVTAARVAAAAPWVVLLMMSTRPEAARAFNSSTGALVVIAGAGATLVGYRLMLAAARLPEDKRLSA